MILTPQELVSKSINLLEQSGWTQGQLRDSKDGPYCMYGAMYFSIPKTVNILENYVTLGIVLDSIESKVGDHIINWNDEKDRTQEDVINLLKEVLVSYDV